MQDSSQGETTSWELTATDPQSDGAMWGGRVAERRTEKPVGGAWEEAGVEMLPDSPRGTWGAELQKWAVEGRFREWNKHFGFQIFYI